ncbi:MAG TPA: hypothetical protein DCM28_03495 [Phycisphaerales bacterium]|nr:hypothetical protein [Phycisphaerales bacterium]HCD31839.1 hypothetical protein [Phycisphaerales bacterium]
MKYNIGMSRQLGQLESAALAYLQLRNLRKVQSGDLTVPLRIAAKQERELLSRMARKGIIANVRKGLYLFPEKLPLGGIWTPEDALAINTLLSDRQAKYQITGPNAFNYYGFDEQIPVRYFIYNDVISGQRQVGKLAMTLIKLTPDRLGSTEDVKMPSGQTMIYSSRVRTLMDAVYDWSRFGSLPRAYDWIRKDLESDKIKATDLVKTTLQYGNLGTIRRIGALLEQMNVNETLLKRLEKALKPASSKIAFIPKQPLEDGQAISVCGPLCKRWGVVMNG